MRCALMHCKTESGPQEVRSTDELMRLSGLSIDRCLKSVPVHKQSLCSSAHPSARIDIDGSTGNAVRNRNEHRNAAHVAHL
ncbi:hypothetical protein M513_11946 [Trichuris suis]|uniref:Uncharacterized protein n=1 Tax=Trichuris suis TaxID=68888 RepID=A0A085LQD1_9BILA|nr:hypothetical protein M513_11946 [Trichuris suis]